MSKKSGKAIPAGDRWINSDSQIIGKVKQSSHKQGILCSVTMPWGDECQAVVEKWDANSAIQFCELVRSTYHARRDEEEAKQASKAARKRSEQAESGDGGENLTSCEVSGSPPQKTVEVDFTDRTSVANRINDIRNREAALNTESNRLRVERTKLLRIMEVLDKIEEEENASQDDGQAVPSVPTKTPSRGEPQDGVDRGPREEELQRGGEEDSRGDDTEV